MIVVACLPAEVLDSTGLFHALWLERIARIANDAQSVDRSRVTGRSSWSRRLSRWRSNRASGR